MIYSFSWFKSLYMKAISDEFEYAIISSCNIGEIIVELL
jgi:hypothetical protein